MLITDIASFDKNRRRIYIDYEYAFPLYLSELKKFGIKSGTELSEDIYAEIIGILERRVKERILYLPRRIYGKSCADRVMSALSRTEP